MKTGEIKKVAQDYQSFFPSEWKNVRGSFYRRHGSWLQIVAFNPSRFNDVYEPRSCAEFLKKPGPVAGSMLLSTLREKKHNVTRWISLKEHAASFPSIWEDMAAQFRPAINRPLQLDEVKSLLQLQQEYWPHVYALCVMAAEEGNQSEAKERFDHFCRMMADKPFDWAMGRRSELEKVMELLPMPTALKAHLDEIERVKLASAKLDLQP